MSEELIGTEEKVRNDAERLEFITDSIPALITYVDSQQRYRFNNKAYQDWFGSHSGQLYGQHVRDVLGEAAYEAVRLHIERALSGEDVIFEGKLSYKGAGTRAIRAHFVPDIDETGTVRGYVALINDISEQKRSDDTIQSLIRISEKLNSTLEIDHLMDVLVEESIKLVDAESGFSGLQTAEGMVSRNYIHQGVAIPLTHCWAPGVGVPGWLLEHKRTYITNEAATDPQIIHGLWHEYGGLRSAISTPILNAHGEILGFLQIHNKKSGGFSSTDKDRLASIAHSAAIAIQNALAYQAARRTETVLRESADRLGLALDSAKLGDWSWDAATDTVTFSARAGEIFGIPSGPFMTWTQMRGLLHEEDRERARLAVEQAIADRTDYDIEYRLRRPDGTQVWVAAKGRAIYADDGEVRGMRGVVQDITDQKLVYAQLQEEREILETINRFSRALSAELDSNVLIQGLTDTATEIVGAAFGSFFYNVLDENGAAYMLYTLSGVPQEHFEHFPMPRATDLFGPTFRGEGVIRIGDVKKDARYGKNSPYYGMPPGHLPVISYLAAPVVSRSGEVLGGLFFGHPAADVFTERHERILSGLAGQAAITLDNARLFEGSRKARQEAEMANRLKDEFLATVSHELRTPLNSIFGWARMLRTGKLDEASAARALETIERNARAQQQIIEDILEVSRIIMGKVRLDVSPVEIAPAIEAAVDVLRPTAEAKDVRLQIVLDSKPNLVLGDSNRLQQIVWNLLSNAIKFTPRGGRVQIALSRINSHVELSISDTGQGISSEFLPYVFDRFRQADSSLTRDFGGLGLGLAIVRHLVELHGGSVSASSPGKDQGATFIVRFPLAVMRESLDRFEGELALKIHAPAIGAQIVGVESDLRGIKVLAVDDEADARDLIASVLKQCGAEVKTTSSLQETLDVLEQWKPDVLISDIGMPVEDGYTLIRRVRTLPHDLGGNIPAIALTAYARSEDRVRALSAGYHTHVAKPVEPSELAAVVASLRQKF